MSIERREPMTEEEILHIIDEEIRDAVSYYDDSILRDRETALEYYQGTMRDLPSPDGWSSFVSKDVADTLGLVLPGLLRIFDGANNIVEYQPNDPNDEPGDEQATDYVNYVWRSEANGYEALYAAIHDALLFRNGIIKAWWDTAEKFESEELTGLSDEQLTMLMQDKTVEIVGHSERQEFIEAPDPQTGQPGTFPMNVHDVSIRRMIQKGRLRIMPVPSEEFLKDRNSRYLEDSRFVGHRVLRRRSDLISEGYDREKIEMIPTFGSMNYDQVRITRDNSLLYPEGISNGDSSTEEVEIMECYPLIDVNGDGVAERMKVVVGGASGARQALFLEPWPDDHPFVDLKAKIEPHRWQGRSLADDTMDIQRVKTALLRSTLDNLYQVNRPQREVVENQIIDPDEVLEPKIGGVIRVKQAGAINDLVVPFIGDKAMQGLNYMDQVTQKRTGVSTSTMALDGTALDPQTATAEQIDHDSSYAQTELIARNLAETGLKKLFRKVLRLIVRNQDRPRTIRLRGKWVEMDPRSWNANMDATINIGLGTGSRERDLGMLRAIGQEQDKIVAQLGPDNPIVSPSMYVKTRQKMVEAGGMPNPDMYFADVSAKDYQQWQQQKDASKPPDPKVMEMQMKQKLAEQELQTNHAKNQLDEERIRAKLEAEVALKKQELDSNRELEQMKIEAETVRQQAKLQAETEQAGVKAQLELQMFLAKLEHEKRLQDERHAHEHTMPVPMMAAE